MPTPSASDYSRQGRFFVCACASTVDYVETKLLKYLAVLILGKFQNEAGGLILVMGFNKTYLTEFRSPISNPNSIRVFHHQQAVTLVAYSPKEVELVPRVCAAR
jgi:hypothetical protein